MNSSYKLAFWWPETRKIRTGRSADGYTFDRETTGALIRSQVDYSFADALQNQNILVMHREENDSVYRGDTSPEESLVGMGNTMSDSWSDLFASDSEDSDTDQLAPSSPDPLPNSSPASTRASTPDEQLGSPHTPYRRIITYTAHDKNRVERERAQLAAVAPPPVPLRRSMRLQPAVPFQPDPARGIFTIPQLRTDGNAIHPWINDKPRPLIDRNNVIMAVVAGAPKYNALWWDGIQREAFRFLVRVFKTANFSELDGEPRLRFGMTFGEDYAGVHQINNLVPNLSAIKQLENCEYLQAISGYQNHLYQHFAAYGHATVRSKVDELLRREIAFPGYQDSVFTTTDISISGPSSLSRKDVAAAFDTMEVITVLGSWNPRTGGGIVFWDNLCVLELIPGATVMFPAGSKRYSLVAVAPHETRFVFRQYCHAGVLRWVEKGGRSDTEFDLGASDHEKDIWENIRAKRGHKMFSKLEDIFVI